MQINSPLLTCLIDSCGLVPEKGDVKGIYEVIR